MSPLGRSKRDKPVRFPFIATGSDLLLEWDTDTLFALVVMSTTDQTYLTRYERRISMNSSKGEANLCRMEILRPMASE